MRTKVQQWPIVRPDDNGIRPGGRSDECFYCHSQVGQPHGERCVCVTSLIQYRVYMNLGHGEKEVGAFRRQDPHFWSAQDCEFHKNESSWCADNALDQIDWDDETDAKLLETWMESKDRCSCGPLRFEYNSTVDEGPFIQVNDAEDDEDEDN